MTDTLVPDNPLWQRVQYRLSYSYDRASRAKWHVRKLRDVLKPVDIDPTVALVVIGRNDNYGGDFSGRLKATMKWNLQFPFNEVFYIEWNPVVDRPSDTEWLVNDFPEIKTYIVSGERHAKCCTNPKMPVMEYFAKNVGIRRATSKWICLVNADVLIGRDVFRRMRKLRPGTVYGTHSENITWLGGEINDDDLNSYAPGSFSATNELFSVAGNFLLAPRDLFHAARGFDESLTDRRISCDSHGVAQLFNLGARARVLGLHYHLNHPESCRIATFAHQGAVFDPWDGVPYRNDENWGQADAEEKQIRERTWLLE
jgi:hypothetical protein